MGITNANQAIPEFYKCVYTLSFVRQSVRRAAANLLPFSKGMKEIDRGREP